MKLKAVLCILLTALLLCSCAPVTTPASTTTQPTTKPTTQPTTKPTQGSQNGPSTGLPISADTAQDDQQALFDALFDLNNKISLRLHMDEHQIALLQQDYEDYSSWGSKSPIYRMADLEITVGDDTYFIRQVGVRMKGNTSRTDFYSPEEGIHSLIHLKLDFQETFDDPDHYGTEALTWDETDRENRKDRTFATLEKMDLRWNKCDDSSYIKEYYAYEMYRDQGVPAPHTNLATLNWSGLHMGVYTINEPIDKVFLKKYLPKEQQGGDLYKLGWTHVGADFTSTASIGIEDEDAGAFFCYDLKTNKKTSTHESLKKLIAALNSGNVTKEDFAQLVDVEEFLRYSAVSYLLGNPDDLRNNYNNCYIYFRGDTGQMMVFPYDFDRCLGVTHEWNPTGDGVTSDNPFSKTLASGYGEQKSPLFLYSICAGGYYVRQFAAELTQVADSKWMDTHHFLQVAALAKSHYEKDIAPGKEFRNAKDHSKVLDPDKTSDFSSQGNISFARYVQAKKNTLAKYMGKLDEYAAGKPSISVDLYLRADFTDWNVKAGWELEPAGEGRWQIRLNLDKEARFKIFSQGGNAWYGSEVLSEQTTVKWETDGHTNIVLPKGSYLVVFDPVSQTITVTAT